MKRVILAGLIGAVALATLATGSWWFFIREDATLATSAPDIPEGLVNATASPVPGTGDAATATDEDVLTFKINPDLSEAAYFVDEELASLGIPSTAKGSTTEIEGEFNLTVDGATLAPGTTSQFTVQLGNLTSDESRRDGRVQQALETSTFPAATFTISSITGYDASIPEGEEQTLQLSGTLDLHGVQREVTWDVKAFREGNVISALATVAISFADFDITPPTFAGLVSIDDQATLQVQLIAEAA